MTVPDHRAALEIFADNILSGRTALVTGGGSGIGRACALLLSRLGADVAVTGRRIEALEATCELAARAGAVGVVRPFSGDIREPEQVEAMVADVVATQGSIDFLINNAGGQFMSPAEDISYKGFRAVTRLNLDATWYTTVQVARQSMIPRGFGRIVSITMTPRTGIPGMSHSSAARAGVESLTRTLSVEWGKYGIRINAIAPGIVHTEAWENYGLDPAHMGEAMPVGRLQTADDIAALVTFLVSPAGDYINGATITADGGFSNQYPLQL